MISEKEFKEYVNQTKKISSEKEYWEVHKYWKKKITKLTKDIVHFLKDPKRFSEDYEEILNEGVKSQLITLEYKNEKLKTFYKEMNSPTKFKADVKTKLEKLKNKLSLSKDKINK